MRHLPAWVALSIVLGAALVLSTFSVTFFGLKTHEVVRTVHVGQRVSDMTGQQIAAALGRPDQTQTQNGETCGIWRSRKLILCWA